MRTYDLRAAFAAPASAILVALAAAIAFLPRPAEAHDKLGANLNFIGDFRRNHEFADIVKQSRRFLKIGQFDDTQNANLAPVGADGWPTTDFRLFAMAAQQDTQNLSGAYTIVFNGQATLSTSGGGAGTITGQTFDAGTNTTRATLNFPARGRYLSSAIIPFFPRLEETPHGPGRRRGPASAGASLATGGVHGDARFTGA